MLRTWIIYRPINPPTSDPTQYTTMCSTKVLPLQPNVKAVANTGLKKPPVVLVAKIIVNRTLIMKNNMQYDESKNISKKIITIFKKCVLQL